MRILEKIEHNNFILFILQTFIIVAVALPIVVFDIQCEKYRINNSIWAQCLIDMGQLFTSIVYVYIIMIYLTKITTHIQESLPGIFFPGMFFSLQVGMIHNIYKNIKMIV
jgi:cell shape-determining protein MreD